MPKNTFSRTAPSLFGDRTASYFHVASEAHQTANSDAVDPLRSMQPPSPFSPTTLATYPGLLQDDFFDNASAGEPLTGNVLANDVDANASTAGSVLQVNGQAENVGQTIDALGGGRITVEADGAFIFDPNGDFDDLSANESRPVSVVISTTDGDGSIAVTTLQITVVGAPAEPEPGPGLESSFTATSDRYTVTAGQSTTVQPLSNDRDPEAQLPSTNAMAALFDGANRIDLGTGGTPYGTPITLASGTTVTVEADGSIRLLTPPDLTGVEGFDYLLADGAASDRATITLTRVDKIAPVVDLSGSPALAPVELALTGTPVLTGNGTGQTAVWTNVGTVTGQPVDLQATVIATTVDDLAWSVDGNDAALNIQNRNLASETTVRWEVLDTTGSLTGTAGTPVEVQSQLAIGDIDASEVLRLQRNIDTGGLAAITANTISTLTLSETATELRVQGQLEGADEPSQQLAFTYTGTAAVVTYGVDDSVASATFTHDGNQETTFNDPRTSFLPLDIDFATSWTEGEGPVAIAATSATATNGNTAATVSDIDSTNLASATVRLTNARFGDVLTVSENLPGGLSSRLNTDIPGEVTVTLAGSASLRDYAAALRTIRFNSTAPSPDTVDRVIEVVVNDGQRDSVPASTTLTINVTDDNPIVDLDVNNVDGMSPNSSVTFAEAGGAIAVAGSGVNISGRGEGDVTELVIATGPLPDGADEVFTVAGEVFVGNRDRTVQGVAIGAATVDIVYTFDGSDGQFQIRNSAVNDPALDTFALSRLVREIIYENTSTTPALAARSLTFTAIDAAGNQSNAAVATIAIQATNNTPIINLDPDNSSGGLDDGGFDATFVQGQGPVAVTDQTDADVDDANENDLTELQIVGTNFVDGADERVIILGEAFAASDRANVAVQAGSSTLRIDYVANARTFTIRPESGTMPRADLDVLIENITYANTSGTPTEGTGTARTLTFTAVDQAGSLSTSVESHIEVVSFSDAPVLNLDPNNVSGVGNGGYQAIFTEGDGPLPVLAATDAVLTDGGEGDVIALRIAVNNLGESEEERLTVGTFRAPLDQEGTFAAGTWGGVDFQVTVAANGSGDLVTIEPARSNQPVDQTIWNAILRTVAYEDVADNPRTGEGSDRTFIFEAEDAVGVVSEAVASTMTLLPVNDAPLVLDDGIFTVSAGRATAVQPLLNDRDPENDPIKIIAIIDGANRIPITVGTPITLSSGTQLRLLADGSLEITATEDATGNERFEYEVGDGNGGRAIATVTVERTSAVAPVIDLNGPTDLNLLAIQVPGDPIPSGGVGTTGQAVGEYADWLNATTINGESYNLRAEITRLVDGEVVWLTLDDDPRPELRRLGTGQSEMSLRWTLRRSSDGAPPTSGQDIEFIVGDLDAPEQLRVDRTNLTSTALFPGSNVVPSETATEVVFQGTRNTLNDPRESVRLRFASVAQADITYIAFNTDIRGFQHDTDQDTKLVSSVESLQSDDIDYATTYIEGGLDIPITAENALTSDIDDAALQNATIVLTNPQAGDQLSIGRLPAGITGTVATSQPDRITVNLTGEATVNDYASAIRGITFANATAEPDTTPRNIEVQVDDSQLSSVIATSTIDVEVVNNAPILNLDPTNESGGLNDGNFIATFTEGMGAIALTPPLADVDDVRERDIVALTLVANNFNNAAEEFVAIGGTPFAMASDASVQSVAIGNTQVDIAYDAATSAFTIVNSLSPATPIPQVDLEALHNQGMNLGGTGTSPNLR